MNYLINLVTLLSANYIFAQFGLVQDNDGFANIRNSDNLNSAIITTVVSGKIYPIFIETKTKKWFQIEYKANLQGYIFHNRVMPLTHFKKINPTHLSSNKVEFSTKDYTIIIEIQKI